MPAAPLRKEHLRYGPAPVRALGIPLLLFLAGLIVFGAVAGPRLLRPSRRQSSVQSPEVTCR